MKTAASCVAFVCLLLLGVGSAIASLPVADLSQPVSISGQWRFQPGDDPAWAAVDLDDSSWIDTTVPASYPQGLAGYGGMLWYRLTLDLDLSRPSVSENVGALAVNLGNIMSAYELYAGGQRIGGVGRLPPQQQVVYDHHRAFSIPASAVDTDGRLVLALRVWRDPEAPDYFETGPYQGEFLLGNVGDLRERMLRKALLPKFVLAVLYLVVGLYHLLIARRNPVLKEFFWFGLFTVAMAVYTFETSQSRFFVDIPYLWHKKIEFQIL